MKKPQLSALITVCAILSISLVMVFYSFYKVVYIEEIDMDIKVGGHIGVNIDNDALHFGMVPGGACSHRSIIVKHEFDYPTRVMARINGEIRAWTLVENNDALLDSDGEVKMVFHVCPPRETEYQDYTGTARIFFERV